MSDIQPPRLDFNELVVSLGKASEEMQAVKEQLRAANTKSALAKNVAVIGMIIGVLGVAVGAGGLIYAERANDTADEVHTLQIERAREQIENRIVSCIQQNVQTNRMRKALVSGVSVLVPPEGPSERLTQFIESYTANVNDALPFRDCSPRGIETYFESPPGDPAAGG